MFLHFFLEFLGSSTCLYQDNGVVGSVSSTAISIEAAGGGNYKYVLVQLVIIQFIDIWTQFRLKVPNVDLCFTLKSPTPRTGVIKHFSSGYLVILSLPYPFVSR